MMTVTSGVDGHNKDLVTWLMFEMLRKGVRWEMRCGNCHRQRLVPLPKQQNTRTDGNPRLGADRVDPLQMD